MGLPILLAPRIPKVGPPPSATAAAPSPSPPPPARGPSSSSTPSEAECFFEEGAAAPFDSSMPPPRHDEAPSFGLGFGKRRAEEASPRHRSGSPTSSAGDSSRSSSGSASSGASCRAMGIAVPQCSRPLLKKPRRTTEGGGA